MLTLTMGAEKGRDQGITIFCLRVERMANAYHYIN